MKVDKFRLKVEALGLDRVIENKRGIMVLPQNCTPYLLFMNNEPWEEKEGVLRWRKFMRNWLLKRLLSIVETLARW